MTDRLERLINLVIALRESRAPMTTEEVRRRVAGYGQADAEAFRRMFERDKADLRALGVPLETAPLDAWEDRVGYRIDPRRYDLPEVALEPEELTALALALEATGLADEAGTGLLKLGVDAGDPAVDRGGPPPVEIDVEAPHRALLMEAQATRTRVRFDYRRPGEAASTRTVDPHALVHRRGRWYVVGHDHDRGARRAFRLDRIEGPVRTTGRAGAFEPPATVDVDDVVPPGAPAPEVARVHAAPAIAWQVARRARGGGRPVDDTGDRDGRTAFDVSVRDADEFVAWALEYGPELEVVGPRQLRDAVIDRLERLLADSADAADAADPAGAAEPEAGA